MADLRERWGTNLREARLRAGLTQVAVAERLGVTQQAILEWEKGRAAPPPERQVQLVALFEVDERELFPLTDVA